MASEGEEFECAQIIDTLSQVKFWVRNLSNRPQTSFWLPTSTDRFYPDFVVMLTDGRILVIEYKGADRLTNDDTKEKTNVGELWANKSDRQSLFLLASMRDQAGRTLKEQILKIIT